MRMVYILLGAFSLFSVVLGFLCGDRELVVIGAKALAFCTLVVLLLLWRSRRRSEPH